MEGQEHQEEDEKTLEFGMFVTRYLKAGVEIVSDWDGNAVY
jgi:hypothetical protein